MNRRLALLALSLSLTFPVFSVEVIPVVNLEFYGGQTRFDGDDSSFTGNGSWSLAAAMPLSEKTTLLPSYSGLLRRTVQVQELIGGSLLTQSEQVHNLNLKSIHKLGDSAWKMKPRLGYKKDLLRESSDEGWGDGLFDYDKYAAGVEFERVGEARVRSFSTGLDLFLLRYPNFESLSSSEFGSEIAAGTDVLDLDAVDWLTSLDLGLWERGYLNISLLVSPRFYTDAKVIEETGTFGSDKRQDLYLWNAYNISQTFNQSRFLGIDMENTLGFTLVAAMNSSNQNNFDADQTQFTDNYYSYSEYQAGPRWGAKYGQRWESNVAYNYAQRIYSDRPVQSQTGDYTSGKVVTEVQTYTGQVSYNLSKAVAFFLSGAYQVAKANQKFEQTYQYNFDSAHFFIGVSYSN